jgi:enoyl-CoA hydratase/carnithine racemase
MQVSKDGEIATVTLNRGKVNALNEPMVEELTKSFEDLETDNEVRSIIFTGSGKFFSFGFDVPEFLNYSKSDFIRYLEKFTNFYTYLFLFPKPRKSENLVERDNLWFTGSCWKCRDVKVLCGV